MPPSPFVIVMLAIFTVAPLATRNTRTALPPLTMPLTMVFVRPLPVIVSAPLFARSGNALSSVIVPLALGAKVIVSAVERVLARVIASRSEQSFASQLPSSESVLLVTTSVCTRAGVGVGAGGVGVGDGPPNADS